MKKTDRSKCGFASMDPQKQKEIARMGGKAVSKDTSYMAEIGRKGGIKSGSQRSAKRRTKAEMDQLTEP